MVDDSQHLNKKYGKLLCVKFEYSNRHGKYYLFKCDCGNTKIIMGSQVFSGKQKSCGCSRRVPRLPNNRAEVNAVFLAYKRSAKIRKIKFNLTYEQFDTMIRQPCFYCGKETSNISILRNAHNKNRTDGFKYNGIDRKDSSKGYVIDNVVPCCSFCNRAKRDLSVKEFLKNIERIHLFQVSK